jgi:GT2 family glycosyltransferase/glycosyltransferase involved in cell wall biosynthesis
MPVTEPQEQGEATFTYHHPPGSEVRRDERGGCVLIAPGTAGVPVDEALARLWQLAGGRRLEELAGEAEAVSPHWREALQALRLAGLLLPRPASTRTRPALPEPAPLVSMIIPTKNGRHHLAECLPSLQAQRYPHLEIILVDDHSTDGTAEFVRSHFPGVRLVPQTGGSNFAAACNLGAQQAGGDYFFFLNNDTLLDAYCVQEAVAAHRQAENAAVAAVAAVAAMMRFYRHPAFINGLGAGQRRFGFGYDIGIGHLDVGQFEHLAEVPALCFGAALVTRSAWQEVGSLDTRYQFYYEDADWSYRARLLGYRLVPAPHALVYHKFSASMKEKSQGFKVRLASRNRLWFAAKNLPMWEAPLQLACHGLDDVLRFWQALFGRRWHVAGAVLLARLQFYMGLPAVLAARRRLRRRQPVRLASSPETLPLAAPLAETPFLSEGLVAGPYRPFLQAAGGAPVRRRLLIISPDAVHSRMGGVGIRYWELARQLADVADVKLAVPQETDLSSTRFELHRYQEGQAESLRAPAEAADVILLSGFTVYHHPFLSSLPAHKVVDLYDPMILENLERFAAKPMAERLGLHQVGVSTFNELFRLGDFFICASEKQRDYWLGGLTAAGRVNLHTYTADATLRRLIDVVPTGLPDERPQPAQPVLKGVWPGIAAADKVILWGGGLWDWLDPLTVIEAMPAVLADVPQARLFFLGTKHPNPAVPPSRMAERAIARAQALGLKDTAVFFNDWTPYQERVDYLLEADVGVSLHQDHIETRFSVRTRLMDYLWARLPMVVSGGDVLGDLVEEHRLGRVVAAGDVAAVAGALVEMLQSPAARARFEPVVARFGWSQVVRPLAAYVAQPWHNDGSDIAAVALPHATPIRQLPAKALASLRLRGLRGLRQDVGHYLRWIGQR